MNKIEEISQKLGADLAALEQAETQPRCNCGTPIHVHNLGFEGLCERCFQRARAEREGK